MRKISLKSKFFFVLFSLIVSLFLVEAYLHVISQPYVDEASSWRIGAFFPEFDRLDGKGLYYAHPYFSYAMKPDVKGKTNNLGFRGKDVSIEKSEGVYRIVCIGGSTTYGSRNPDDYTYPKLLEGEFNKRGGKKVEVINAGLVNSTTAETLHRLCSEIIPLSPDLVIIYHGFNDLIPRIADNFRADYSHFRRIPLKPWYGLYGSLNHFYTIRFIKWVLKKDINLNDYLFAYKNIPKSENQRRANFYKNGARYFKYNMELMVKILLANDIKVIIPTFAYCRGNKDGWVKIFPDGLWEIGIAQNNEVIREIVKKYNLPEAPFYEFCLHRPELFSGQIHMNNTGSVEQARFLYKRIIEAYPDIPRPLGTI